jgi:HEPN domain-containing protein
MKNITSEWLRYADIDLKTAREILGDEYLTPSIAFHCHQCIEKSFKAILVENNIVPPKIHNLLKLLAFAKANVYVDVLEESISYINETYIDARYPGDVGLLPDGVPSTEMAKKFYEITESVYNKIYLLLTD